MEKKDDSLDLSTMSREQLVATLDTLLHESEVQEIMPVVEELESLYRDRTRELIEQERQSFIEDGGYAPYFEWQKDKTESRFTELINIYHSRKEKYLEKKKQEEEANLQTRRQIIEDLKMLIEKGESIGKAFQQFRELREKWKNTGDVAETAEEKLNSEYRYQVERFYNLIRLTQGFKEYDLEKHYEAKNALLQEMEALLQEKTIRKVEKLLRKYHDEWFDIGPVPESKKEEIISRFNELTHQIRQKINDHYAALLQKYQENLKAKEALCEQAEALAAEDYRHFKVWYQKTKELLGKQEQWRKIGRVPREHADQIWERFRAACNTFFEKKNAFFQTLKATYAENQKAKETLCAQAEALQHDTNWEETAKKLISLQRKWEKIGPAGAKEDRQLWKRFRTACDTFFEARKQYMASLEAERYQNLKSREAILARLNELLPSISSVDALPVVKALVREWESAGEVPASAREDLFKRFTQTLDACYDKMGLDEAQRELLKYQNKIDRLKSRPDAFKLLQDERKFLRNKIRQLEEEVVKTENNMGFFSNADKLNALLQDVIRKLEHNKLQLTACRKKLELVEKNIPEKKQIR
ncbi:MAG: hypothetical protein KatS3mg031_1439 [Chitinophagales bacterium]|nr:MAG: hypothetical protein KatS3mg031_1439 [Chitinophagales bacterium]